jgi:hypothetical protein
MSLIDDERPQVNEVYSKLIEAKKQFGKALKNANNPHFKSRYADLQSVLDAISEAFQDKGLFVSQNGESIDGKPYLRTLVFDANGSIVDFGVLPIKTIKDDAQAFGSGLTYARRYALMSAFGLAPEDDDGQLASISSPVDALRQQVVKLGKECIALGITPSEVQGALKGVEAKNLTEHQAHQGIDSLTKIIEMTKKGKA